MKSESVAEVEMETEEETDGDMRRERMSGITAGPMEKLAMRLLKGEKWVVDGGGNRDGGNGER